ncbi:MAG: hypothetical protein ABWZ25_10565 [Chitinophagaceae bacterium]
MFRLPVYISIFILLLSSCKVIDPVGQDRSFGPERSTTRLQLYPDSSFELALLDPHHDSLLISGLPSKTFSVKGKWKAGRKDHWLLIPDNKTAPSSIDDSISRFTSINSFTFWDKYGSPINIRSIRFGRSRPKPHYGNSLFFFAQDFKETDTVRFEMDGYDEFSYPGSIRWSIGNNGHKITIEARRAGALPGPLTLVRKRNRLYFSGSGTRLLQK